MTKNKELKINLTLKVCNNFTEKDKKHDTIFCVIPNPSSSATMLNILFRNHGEILCDTLNFSQFENTLPAAVLASLFLANGFRIEKEEKYITAQKLVIVGQKDRLLWKNKILETYHKFCPSITVGVTDDGQKIEIVALIGKIFPSDKLTIEDNKMTLVFDSTQTVERMMQMDVFKCPEITIIISKQLSETEELKLYDDLVILLDALTSLNTKMKILVLGAKLEFQQRYMFHHPLNAPIAVYKIAHLTKLGRCYFGIFKLPIPSSVPSSN